MGKRRVDGWVRVHVLLISVGVSVLGVGRLGTSLRTHIFIPVVFLTSCAVCLLLCAWHLLGPS